MVDREEERDRRRRSATTDDRGRARRRRGASSGVAAARPSARERPSAAAARRSAAWLMRSTARARGTRRPSARSRRGAACSPLQPKSSRARDASRLRRGWPFGIDVSHVIAPVEADRLRDELGRLADRRLDPRAEVHRLGAVVALGRADEPVDAVVDVEVLARRRAVAPQHDLVGRLDHLADQRRDHVRRLRGRSCRPARRGSSGRRKIAFVPYCSR